MSNKKNGEGEYGHEGDERFSNVARIAPPIVLRTGERTAQAGPSAE
jgi:hypothetical protein